MDPAVALSAAERMTVSRILRVNHAGELAAIRIYGAQIALSPRASDLRPFLVETQGHEREHLRRFQNLMPDRATRPCGVAPLWALGGAVLGAATGLMGRNAVLICTEAVERTVHRHLADQLVWLAKRDPEVFATVEDIQIEELSHLAYARSSQVPAGAWAKVLNAAVAITTDILIWASTYGASARMARDLRSSQIGETPR